MKKLFAIATFLTLSSSQSYAACDVTKNWKWQSGLMISAKANGAKCSNVVIEVSISSKAATIWQSGFESKNLMGGDAVKNKTDLKTWLSTWFEPMPKKATTFDNPDWPLGYKGDLPPKAEFPFMPAENLTQKTYTAIRNKKAPLYCYVQGFESQNCVYYLNGKIENFGIQRFPG